MNISRMDLDGKGAGSPEGLVRLIFKCLPDRPTPVPVEELCAKFDIIEITMLETDGFEGGLITDPERSSGIILVNAQASDKRRRFTIAHELGHFLIPTHVPNAEGRFLCSRADLLRLTAGENDRRAAMEVQANRFASLLLLPPPYLRPLLASWKAPDLQHIPQLSRTFNVSKEAVARAYAELHQATIAILIIHDGIVKRVYKSRDFPFLLLRDRPVPRHSAYHAAGHQRGIVTDFAGCDPEDWIELKPGAPRPELYEQVYQQRDGYAMILLHLELPDEDEEEEESDLRERWRVGFRR